MLGEVVGEREELGRCTRYVLRCPKNFRPFFLAQQLSLWEVKFFIF